MTTVVISGFDHAKDPTERRQGESVGRCGSGHPRQTVRDHQAWQAGSRRPWLRELGAAGERAVLWPASHVGSARARRFARTQPLTDARCRIVTRYLIDTNVISAVAPTAAVGRPDLIRWMDSHSTELFLSAVTIAEIADGIA